MSFRLRSATEVKRLLIEMDYAAKTATEYQNQLYEFQDVDIILLESIYLLKRPYKLFYDLAIWIDGTYEIALERALARSQEGLPPGETIRAYQTIYFPAQEIHFQRDDPKKAADLIVVNDPRVENPPQAANVTIIRSCERALLSIKKSSTWARTQRRAYAH